MALTDRPIPGQSLTTPPKQFPHERPPETTNPLEALDRHFDNLDDSDTSNDVATALENGIDIVTLVEGILRSAVMEGIHGLDVSMLIAPHLHEFIKGEAEFLGIDYDEGFIDEGMAENKEKRKIGEMVRRRMKEGTEDSLEYTQLDLNLPAEEAPAPAPAQEPQAESQGLMSRPAPEDVEMA